MLGELQIGEQSVTVDYEYRMESEFDELVPEVSGIRAFRKLVEDSDPAALKELLANYLDDSIHNGFDGHEDKHGLALVPVYEILFRDIVSYSDNF